MQIKNKKISELEEAQDMKGFFTIGYRIIGGVKTSLKFGLEKIQTAYDGMLAIKDDVLNAIRDIRSLEEVVGTAEQERKVEYGEIIQSLHSAGETSSAQTALAKTATDAANAAATTANNAANGIDAKMQAAIDALIAGAPDALDTLNELAAALGNDPNFATTVLSELGKKLNRTDIINDFTTGGIDKPFSAEMGKLLKSFFDTHNHDGKYQPISNDIAKVYNTTLDVFGIQDGSVVTREQSTEVYNIMDKWNQGYIVTYVDTRQSTFHYGVLNVCRCDDGIPTTLSVINDRGELMAYSFEPTQLERWNVSNISKGNSYYLMTKGLLRNTTADQISLNYNDIRTLETLRRMPNPLIDGRFFYSGVDSSGQQMLVPLNILFDTNTDPFWVNVSFTNPSNGKSYTFNIDSNDDGSDYWASKVTEINAGGGVAVENNEFCELVDLPVTYDKMSSPEGLSIRFTASGKHRQAMLYGDLVFDIDADQYLLRLSHQFIIPPRASVTVSERVMAFCFDARSCMPCLLEVSETNVIITLDTGSTYSMLSDSDYPIIRLIKK